ncbi:MAG: TetR family transcriptional regulator [Alphaproteobacteria bacterium]
MARRTKDEAEKTKHAILNAAEKVFYKHGVSRTSLEQIAAVAGVTRGAVYWHFKDKIELCEAMCERVFLPQEDVLERLSQSNTDMPLDDLKKACCDSLKLIANDKQRQRVISILMFRCEYVEDMAAIRKRRLECKDKMLKQCLKILERAHKLKMLAPGWTPHAAAVCIQSLMGGFIMNGLEGRKEFELAKAAPEIIETFFQSITART